MQQLGKLPLQLLCEQLQKAKYFFKTTTYLLFPLFVLLDVLGSQEIEVSLILVGEGDDVCK